jgi:hypothetical protein
MMSFPFSTSSSELVSLNEEEKNERFIQSIEIKRYFQSTSYRFNDFLIWSADNRLFLHFRARRSISTEIERESLIYEYCIEVRLHDLVVLHSNIKVIIIGRNEFNYQVLSQNNYTHLRTKNQNLQHYERESFPETSEQKISFGDKIICRSDFSKYFTFAIDYHLLLIQK